MRRAAGIEAGGRLVEEEELRVADERDAEVEPALLPARQGLHPRAGLLLEADELDHLVDIAGLRVVPGEHPVYLTHRQRRRHVRRLQDDPDPLAQRRAAMLGVDAEHRHVAAVAGAVPLENLDRRRLTGAVRPEQAEHLALLDGEADAADGFDLAVALAQLAHRKSRNGAHPVSSSSAMPATGNPGSRPSTASAISEQSGWWPTVAIGPALVGERGDQGRSSRARHERLLDAHRRSGLPRDLGPGLPGAEKRAREDEPRRFRESGKPRTESLRLLDSLGGQLAQLVRLPGHGLGMPAEVDAHDRRIGVTHDSSVCNGFPPDETGLLGEPMRRQDAKSQR